jgi:protein TonB
MYLGKAKSEQPSTSVTCRGYCACIGWTSMSLRCLLFSSSEEIVQPIWQVLADLGIEGEHCPSAVDAVERVTTQQFQIVITDWDDQPEAAFLLKTARELKAAQRPLTLAIVSDSAKLPEALKAGANSVLLKPLRPEQVRDTMSTACQLLRAKQQPGGQQTAVPQPLPPSAPQATAETTALAAAAAAGAAPVPNFVSQSFVSHSPEKTFRAGEFLQNSSSAPGQQFDTESEVQKSLDHAAAAQVDALTELEPTAAAVQDVVEEPVEAPQEPLTGWAALQARLTKNAPPPAEEAPAKSELLSYGETPSFGATAAEVPEEHKEAAKKETQAESGSEAALFAYMSGEAQEAEETAPAPSRLNKKMLAGILAATFVVLMAVPQTRQGLRGLSRRAARAGLGWLNPPPPSLPQAVAQHDSFGQSGDEYKLPTPTNIPDATTDPSQIRVLPVVDPTAKPEKNADANAGQVQVAPVVSNAADPNQAGSQSGQNPPAQSLPAQNQGAPAPVSESAAKDPTPTSVAIVPGNTAVASPEPVPSVVQPQTTAPIVQVAPSQPIMVAQPAQNSAPHTSAPANNAGIPSSLKSQIAATTPDPGGAMPAEAAMSSIEPVNLPESAARDLLTQPVDPEYPEAAKASAQRGSVVLQVLIGRDGSVQDAKFLQGSLVFARAAIDAVKQWRFKPYSMNGRAVAVQSVITLKFQPPA